MKSFNHFLREREVSNELRSLLYHIARSVKYINFSFRAGDTGLCGSTNSSGENQLALDVIADEIISDELRKSELARSIASEEKEKEEMFESPRGNFFVAYDPLDGSSLVDANLAIGSIFGIWDTPNIVGQKIDDNMVAAAYAVYGPRITLVISIRNKGTHEFELNDVGEFILKRSDIRIDAESKYFAPGNLRAGNTNPKYKAWIDECITNTKTLRYSGGMVPDLHHILAKGSGIFAYPADEKKTNGKLRLLFECGPFGFIFRECGGLALNQVGEDVLDTMVTEIHQRTPIFIGSKSEVVHVTDMLR